MVEILQTKISGLILMKPRIYMDERGYFFETYNRNVYDEVLNGVSFIQDNESKSTYGVLRGLHFQNPPFDQAKLVRCTKGEVLDVVVDLRKDSPTYGKHEKFLLSDINKLQLFIPRGFAHGFLVKTECAIFTYKVDNIYNKNSEDGLIWNDKELGIDWGIDESETIISPKDQILKSFHDYTKGITK